MDAFSFPFPSLPLAFLPPGSSLWDAIRAWDAAWKIHPILVNFTAALVPISCLSDLLAKLRRSEPLRQTAWWTLLYAAGITPFTALFGWAFWMPDDNGQWRMEVHQWLGTSLAVLLLGLLLWRWHFHRRARWPTWPYLLVALVLVAALVCQGFLGGSQTFSG